MDPTFSPRSATQPGTGCLLAHSSRFAAAAMRLVAIGVAVIAMGWPLAAAGQPAARAPILLSTPAASAVGRATAQDRWVARQRPVAVAFQYLDPQSTSAASRLDVELFDGRMVTLLRDRVEQRGPGNYTWHGKVEGQDAGGAVLTVVNGRIAGSITLFDQGTRTADSYQIESRADGSLSLRHLNPNGFPPDHPPGADNYRAPRTAAQPTNDAGATTAAGDSSALTAAADTGSTIDVMVVYSNQTATAAGTAIGAQIQQAVDRANTAYANSGISMRLRLVHYEAANYSESGNFSTDLNRLTSATDGFMDNVHSLRNTHGADLVSLFIENTQYCGIAWIGPSAGNAFSVINRGCASGNLSYAHELGHNFGARHDTYVDSATTPYRYGHGLTDPGAGWRTVMAYNDACAAAGTSCARIPYFSNPNLTYGSPAHSLGSTSTADNARVHNENAYTIANFRSAAAGGCTYALSPASVSAGAAATSGSSSVTADTGCAWNSVANAPWLSIGAGTGTSGSGTLYYAASSNTGPARSGTLTIGGQAFTVSQASGCTYTLSPTSASVASGGATGSFTLSTGAGCVWNASSSATWLTLTSPASGTGTATVTWSAAANAGAQRVANLTVGGATFTVTEAAATVSSAAIATLSATSLSFGRQKVGTASAVKQVTLTNTGGGTLSITALTSGGANPADFARSGTCAVNTALGAGQSCTIRYTFTPAATGNRSASLSIATSATTANLSLSGRGR